MRPASHLAPSVQARTGSRSRRLEQLDARALFKFAALAIEAQTLAKRSRFVAVSFLFISFVARRVFAFDFCSGIQFACIEFCALAKRADCGAELDTKAVVAAIT